MKLHSVFKETIDVRDEKDRGYLLQKTCLFGTARILRKVQDC